MLPEGAGAAPRGDRCVDTQRGLPVQGLRYVPHLVGEPYPHPDSDFWGYYTGDYAQMHKRDLPLIGRHVAANTLNLQPWPTSGLVDQHDGFFEEMRQAGICKVIPSFHVAKYYAEMLRMGWDQPQTDAFSDFAVDFSRFGATVTPQVLGGIEMVAWTVDLSLDLHHLLPLMGDDCADSRVTEDPSFQKYLMLLSAIQQWVHPAAGTASAAPALASAPLLVPLDVSRVSWTEPLFHQKLNALMACVARDVMVGGWSTLFSGPGVPPARWLLSFGEPLYQTATYDFGRQLRNVSRALDQRAVIMVGTQALKRGSANPMNSVSLVEDAEVDNSRYRQPYEEYLAIANETQNLDGFIYDEWMDDWDRGTRGPFFLAIASLKAMREACRGGGRFGHDIDSCARSVGNNGHVYPEFFGLSGTSSQALRHCVHPRFNQSLFGPITHNAEAVGMECASMSPSSWWMGIALALLAFVMFVQMFRLTSRWCCTESAGRKEHQQADPDASEFPEPKIGYVTLCPEEKGLAGGHQIELQSAQMRSNEEAGWWLWTHVTSQMGILERQVAAEVNATRALRARSLHRPSAIQKTRSGLSADSDATDESEEADDLARAMQVIHRRTLEGFAAWCAYVAGAGVGAPCRVGPDPQELRAMARGVEENSERPPPRLFAEALLLRTMESLGEHILQCPERISHLLFDIFRAVGGLDEVGPVIFAVDLDRLQDGLPQMSLHSNPYTRHKMPNGKWELGLNFDDINESGIQCREQVAKTYKEPASVMVVLDFILCYRVPFMLKLYCLAVSGYIYLGSRRGDDISTSHNGTILEPKWLRVNYVQYVALLDAALWASVEASLLVYVLWQRWPSLGHRSPGIPGVKWLVEHLFNLCVSGFGGLWVHRNASFARKPWECAQSDMGVCDDVRAHALWGTLYYAATYWLCRAAIFVLMNIKQVPIFIYGTPDRKTRRESGRGRGDNWVLDMRVNLAWLCMLGVCVVAEVYLILPSMKGLDWSTTCGMDLLGDITGLPSQQGVCTEPDNALTFRCVACLSSVLSGWLLTFLCCLVDIYFVFYFASAVVGMFMGHQRQLNDLKNTSLPIDLRENQGREALLFERTFGPGWRHVWRVMVKSLSQESLICPKQATGLVQAAGISMDEDEEANAGQERKAQKPIHLARFPGLAAERLAFFFQSLKWIDNYRPAKGMGFESSTDALTGDHFDPGSVPTLTQIIPAYNESVLPSVEFLRAGADPDDARNGSPDGQPCLGDLTVPPQGDGVNNNLAFMISQFPDEWVFFAKRLHEEGLLESAESHELYKDFFKEKLSPECVQEVRFWAALRTQTVAKTVIGALQYGRALASLPKVREHYARFPWKRVGEDHVEVILAHQTFGHPEGSERNDEAVQLLMEKFADEALYLVFDLKKGTSAKLWTMVEKFLFSRGGYIRGSFEQASVKCTWDKGCAGLRVLEVLPRKYALRIGQGDFKTQGKAGNQLNGLRFASGHYVQALDCNMGAFIGEGFKVPYVLRMFMPLDKEDRAAPMCRYLGFREYIYTSREGIVGRCHAAAEWTFGTIYQRFLSGMGMRMHYGHPDFVDGFWARNRGGMSKSSPVVNLSEDIFAGFNVRMREEASPHIDALEFEKGREATFNAASSFFSKIAGGSVAVLRSRDNHLLCDRIGLLHSLSFYFTAIAFYMSNYLIDISIHLYVSIFIFFNLAGLGCGELAALGSTFSTEWIISMGMVTLVPQFCEMVLERGAVHSVKEMVRGMIPSTLFYIFQNKNIASAMREGAVSGVAHYLSTGRPPANQHQTWKDIYVSYWKSHYKPAIMLATAYMIYCVLAAETHGRGRLPMVLVVISFVAWVVTPILFSPFPRWNLLRQDLQEFNSFITGGAGTSELDIPEVVARGKRGTVRSLYECGLAEEMAAWTDSALFMLLLGFAAKAAALGFLALALPAEILDFLPAFLVALSFSWLVVLGYFVAGLNNVFLVVSFLVWPAAVPLAHLVIGARCAKPSYWTRMPEYVIALVVFLYLLDVAKELVLISCRVLQGLCPCTSSRAGATSRLRETVRICFVYFFVHQLHIVEAYIILFANSLVSVVLAAVDQVFCNAHTWFLLNSELARTKHGERYMEKSAPFFELDGPVYGLEWWSDSDAESDEASSSAEPSGPEAPSLRPWS